MRRPLQVPRQLVPAPQPTDHVQSGKSECECQCGTIPLHGTMHSMQSFNWQHINQQMKQMYFTSVLLYYTVKHRQAPTAWGPPALRWLLAAR